MKNKPFSYNSTIIFFSYNRHKVWEHFCSDIHIIIWKPQIKRGLRRVAMLCVPLKPKDHLKYLLQKEKLTGYY